MNALKQGLGVIVLLSFLQSCKTLRQSSKHGFNEGYYKIRLFHKKVKAVYVVPDGDSIKVYSRKKIQRASIDTAKSIKLAFPSNEKPAAFENYLFRQHTLDVELLTMLFKYRPAQHPYPHQIGGGFNGVVYLGYRTDLFHLQYSQTPLRTYKRHIRHYAFSIGAFTGIGSAPVSGQVDDGTGTSTTIYYDGFINLTGVSAIIAAERISFGLAVGADHLLDKNRKLWRYQGKPWLGLSVGLNLN